jgi:hypothetical protein
MKNKKQKKLTIPNFKNQFEAHDYLYKVGKKYGILFVSVSTDDFAEQMGTEDWTEKDCKNASEWAIEQIAENVGYVMDNAIEVINANKN